ncbi:MAG: hypothetical protein IJF07_08690 [Lachnospiraceae bacterium]|nr:hypothetical protein [Lachnospiraceae bacterium]
MAIPEGYTPLARIGINYRGEYIPEDTYNQLDAVYYNGSTYLALLDNPAGIPTSDGVNWRYLAKGTAETIIESYTDMMANEVAGYLADALAVKEGFDMVNSGLENKDFVREKSNNSKLSFKWTTYEDGVFYLGGYIGDVEVVRLRQGFDSKALKMKGYMMTKDAEALSDSSHLYIRRQGDFYHVEASVCFTTLDTIESWGSVQIGSVSNWAGSEISTLCVVNSIGDNSSALTLSIDAKGKVYLKTHGAVTGLAGKWFIGRAIAYTSLPA